MHRYNPKTDCKSVRINNDQLEQIALRAIATQCSLLDAKVQTIKRESSSAKSSDQILRSECQSLHRQIDRIQADKMALYERYACGNITKEEYALEKNSAVRTRGRTQGTVCHGGAKAGIAEKKKSA